MNMQKPRRFLSAHNNSTLLQATLSYAVHRRSSDDHPTNWDHDFIQSIQSPYADGEFRKRIEELKIKVKHFFSASDVPTVELELIDKISRLGLAYYFSEEIGNLLARMQKEGRESLHGLNETALCFRLLRQHGYNVSSDVFNKFRDSKGFMNCLAQDAKGLLSLYEAAHLGFPEENILDEAKEFSVKHLKEMLTREDDDSNLAELIKQSLEAPLHHLMPRIVARDYIVLYEKEERKISCLLELAKLDFNVSQALYQSEVKEVSRWWQKVGLTKKVQLFRDHLFESYLWANQIASEPKFSKFRKVLTKFAMISCILDDFYDRYGSPEEVRLFTSAIRRWDLKAMETLPDYLKLLYFILYNYANETIYDILKNFGWEATRFIKAEWIHICEAALKEAEWSRRGDIPSLEKYLENDLVSGGLTVPVHIYYFIEENLTKDKLDWHNKGYQISYLSSLIVRLTDYLALSQAETQEEKIYSSILCHMKDSGESYEKIKYVEDMLKIAWKCLNKESLNKEIPRNFVHASMNSARVVSTMFRKGDGCGRTTGITEEWIKSLSSVQLDGRRLEREGFGCKGRQEKKIGLVQVF
ncbi:uncharacterized protein A4U43_C06F2430 [Asparagus officinalis]|uniref:Uncharacterized protein n=1 Tax=Asparagus officinalis TaxID=4686 RepID=A0A5P1EIY4_ASPOF|nr:uncharacterized protein A4U43_C06F2430 [Asparagus officinalis]